MSDIKSVSRYLWDAPHRSIDYYISSIYFATVDGQFTSVEIVDLASGNDDWEISISGPSTNGIYTDYSVQADGTPGKLVEEHGPYDPRERAWFQSALATPDGAIWSEVYTDFDTQSATLTRAMAVRDENGILLGVAGVDLFLEHIQEFLSTLPISEHSEVFILDSDYLILGAYAPSIDSDNPDHNIPADESPYPFTRAAAKYLQENIGQSAILSHQHELNLYLADTMGHLYFTPLGTGHGVNWTMGIFIPKYDFIGTTIEQVKKVLPLVLVVLFLAVSAIVGFVSFIVRPINDLAFAARQIATGNFNVPVNTRHENEVGELARSIDHMQIQLRQTFDQLLLRDRAIGAVDVGIVICDARQPDLPIVYANEALENLTGYPSTEIIGRNPRIFRSKDHSQTELELIREAIDKVQPIQTILQNTRRDGKEYACELSLSPVRDKAGVLTHFIGIQKDVSLRLESEAQIRQYQKTEAIGQLSRGIAHDFNNLLAIISGRLQLLEESVDKPDLLNHINEADSAIEMGARLSRRLLAFSRQGVLEPETLDINRLVQGIFPMLRASLGGSISLIEQFDEQLWLTHADRSEVENAVINLVINARDAMQESGQICISTSNVNYETPDIDIPPGQYVQLTVADTGTGISPDTLPKIFDPFFTTKAIGKGTGLGLASISGFASQSGGTVVAESRLGEGTAIHLLLPRLEKKTTLDPEAELESPRENLTREKVQRPMQPASINGKTILVVEDNLAVLELTVAQLENQGYTVHSAQSGTEAINLLEWGNPVDLVFSDVNMPDGISGYDIAHWIHANRPACKMLLTTGLNDRDNTVNLENYPAIQLLFKPYRNSELRNALATIFDNDQRS